MAEEVTPNVVENSEAPDFSPHRYQHLAKMMNKYEGIAIFRRFGDLNMINLLDLQYELVTLRSEFKDLCALISPYDEDGILRYGVAHPLPSREEVDVGATKDKIQQQLRVKIREKLKEYSNLDILPSNRK